MTDDNKVKPTENTPKPTLTISRLSACKKKEIADIKHRFITEYPKWGTIYHTAQAIGVSADVVTLWKKTDEEFQNQLFQAEQMPIYAIERSSMRRAIEGKSDLLSIFFLKSRMPDRYGERQKQEIEINIHHVLTAQFVALIQQTVPDHCPHCKNYLGLTTKIADELGTLSARLDPEGADRGSPQQITT